VIEIHEEENEILPFIIKENTSRIDNNYIITYSNAVMVFFFKFILSCISEFCFQWCYKKCSELAGNQMQVIEKKT
jgi:hypothetical protein